MNNWLSVIITFIPILIGIIILIYIYTRKFKELGKIKSKELAEKKFYQAYYGYYFDWLKKYWYVVIPIIIISAVLYSYFYSLRFLIGGIFLVLIGLFFLIANYKQSKILTSMMFYRLAREAGAEHRAKIYFYILPSILLIFGLILIFYSILL
jgi:hypothetical protein